MTRQPTDTDTLRRLFQHFNFRTWLAELETADAPEASDLSVTPDIERAVCETLLTEAQLDHWVRKLNAAPIFAMGIETNEPAPMRAQIVCMSFAIRGEAACLPLGHIYPGAPEHLDRDFALAKLKPLLETLPQRKSVNF